ncbi:MAG: HAMP domain-containing sensor histidine kinase [Candidatus Neomarinimicrobiota bacterium]
MLIGGLSLTVFSILIFNLYHGKKQMLKIVDQQKNELQDLVATKDKFFSIIAHDLRGPIGNLLSFSEVMLEDYDSFGEDEIKRMVASISSMSASTFQLLENLLDWARSQTNQIKVVIKDHNLSRMIDDCVNLLVPQTNSKSIRITSRIPEDICISADQRMLATVFRNLLNNAIKFSRRGGDIEISAFRENGYVRINFRDYGTGIPAPVLANLFQIAGHESRNGTEGETGSGLGLVLCQEFVRKNNGELLVDSTVGVGTTFSVIVPGNQ